MAVSARAAVVLHKEHMRQLRRTFVTVAQAEALAKGRTHFSRREYLEKVSEEERWQKEITRLLDEFHAKLKIEAALITAQIGWQKPVSKMVSIFKAGPGGYIPPDLQEIIDSLTTGVPMPAEVARGTGAYVGLAAGTGELSGQLALEKMGLNQTWAWAHLRNMPQAMYEMRGSKVVQNMYGSHLNRLSKIISDATDPRQPITIQDATKQIKTEWPKLQGYQAERIARTETATVWSATAANAYQANGITEFQSTIATGPSIGVQSEDPCDECVDEAANVHSMDDDLPPWHPNCRCEIVPVLENPDGSLWLPPQDAWNGGEAGVVGFGEAPLTDDEAALFQAPPPGVEMSGNDATASTVKIGTRLQPGDNLSAADRTQISASLYVSQVEQATMLNRVRLARETEAELAKIRARIAVERDFQKRLQAELESRPIRPIPKPELQASEVPPTRAMSQAEIHTKIGTSENRISGLRSQIAATESRNVENLPALRRQLADEIAYREQLKGLVEPEETFASGGGWAEVKIEGRGTNSIQVTKINQEIRAAAPALEKAGISPDWATSWGTTDEIERITLENLGPEAEVPPVLRFDDRWVWNAEHADFTEEKSLEDYATIESDGTPYFQIAEDGDQAIHEIGHMTYISLTGEEQTAWESAYKMVEGDASKLPSYAATNPSEAWAETFTAQVRGRSQAQELQIAQRRILKERGILETPGGVKPEPTPEPTLPPPEPTPPPPEPEPEPPGLGDGQDAKFREHWNVPASTDAQFGITANDLTDNELWRIEQYTNQDTLGSYRNVNDWLRKVTVRRGKPLQEIKDAIEGLDSAIAKAPASTEEMTLYRAVAAPERAYGSVTPGMEITDPAYMSTSLTPALPSTWAGPTGDIWTIKVPEGTKGINVNEALKGTVYGPHGFDPATSKEAEIILERGQTLVVDNIETRITEYPNGNKSVGRNIIAHIEQAGAKPLPPAPEPVVSTPEMILPPEPKLPDTPFTLVKEDMRDGKVFDLLLKPYDGMDIRMEDETGGWTTGRLKYGDDGYSTINNRTLGNGYNLVQIQVRNPIDGEFRTIAERAAPGDMQFKVGDIVTSRSPGSFDSNGNTVQYRIAEVNPRSGFVRLEGVNGYDFGWQSTELLDKGELEMISPNITGGTGGDLADRVAEIKREVSWDWTKGGHYDEEMMAARTQNAIKVGEAMDTWIRERVPQDVRMAANHADSAIAQAEYDMNFDVQPQRDAIDAAKKMNEAANKAQFDAEIKLVNERFGTNFTSWENVRAWNMTHPAAADQIDAGELQREFRKIPEIQDLEEKAHEAFQERRRLVAEAEAEIEKSAAKFAKVKADALEAQQTLYRAERQAVMDALAQVRAMGPGDGQEVEFITGRVKKKAGGEPWARAVLQDAQKMLPRDWLGGIKPIQAAKAATRGYAQRWGDFEFIKVDPREGRLYKKGIKNNPNFDRSGLTTALHELGHAVENTNSLVLQMERAFYEYRTAGQKAQSLRSLYPGFNYGYTETAIPDDFAAAYMGKGYGGSNYELLTMGSEDLFQTAGLENHAPLDPEMRQWLLGMFALL